MRNSGLKIRMVTYRSFPSDSIAFSNRSLKPSLNVTDCSSLIKEKRGIYCRNSSGTSPFEKKACSSFSSCTDVSQFQYFSNKLCIFSLFISVIYRQHFFHFLSCPVKAYFHQILTDSESFGYLPVTHPFDFPEGKYRPLVFRKCLYAPVDG